MKDADRMIESDGLNIYGRVNASISHELKNIFAIISETTGFLGDLSALSAAEEKNISPKELQKGLSSILEEIERGFFTIRQMNKLAHTIDSPIDIVNLMEAIQLALNLADFLSYAGPAEIEQTKNTAAPNVHNRPFLLHALLYLALVHMFKKGGPDKKIKIAVDLHENEYWMISFSGDGLPVTDSFADSSISRIASSTGVAIHCAGEKDCLELSVPSTI